MLMHGCKEGQCSACKSFMLDGEVDLDRYSTFALPDFEEAEGYTLLCRAHPYSDLEIELINYDEEITPQRHADRDGHAPTVEAVEALTHDIRRLVLKLHEPDEPFDVQARASTSTSRSRAPRTSTARSRWPTCRRGGRARVHDQALRGRPLLRPARRRHGIKVGDELEVTGPYGVFTLRAELPAAAAVHRRRRRHGADPVAAALAGRGGLRARRRRFYYGARTEADLFHARRARALAAELPELQFVPALSEADGNGWNGETGLITDVVDRLEERPRPRSTPTCAARRRWSRRRSRCSSATGVPEAHIYFDKFTTTAD